MKGNKVVSQSLASWLAVETFYLSSKEDRISLKKNQKETKLTLPNLSKNHNMEGVVLLDSSELHQSKHQYK